MSEEYRYITDQFHFRPNLAPTGIPVQSFNYRVVARTIAIEQQGASLLNVDAARQAAEWARTGRHIFNNPDYHLLAIPDADNSEHMKPPSVPVDEADLRGIYRLYAHIAHTRDMQQQLTDTPEELASISGPDIEHLPDLAKFFDRQRSKHHVNHAVHLMSPWSTYEDVDRNIDFTISASERGYRHLVRNLKPEDAILKQSESALVALEKRISTLKMQAESGSKFQRALAEQELITLEQSGREFATRPLAVWKRMKSWEKRGSAHHLVAAAAALYNIGSLITANPYTSELYSKEILRGIGIREDVLELLTGIEIMWQDKDTIEQFVKLSNPLVLLTRIAIEFGNQYRPMQVYNNQRYIKEQQAVLPILYLNSQQTNQASDVMMATLLDKHLKAVPTYYTALDNWFRSFTTTDLDELVTVMRVG